VDNTCEVELKNFIEKYLNRNSNLQIIDIGSKDAGQTYRKAFNSPNWTYTGLDIVDGENVDIIAKDGYDFGINKTFDVLVSSNTMEHVEDLKLWSTHLATLLKDDAYVFLTAPSDFPMEHRHPKDCWRIWPDGIKWIMSKVMNLNIIEVYYKDRSCFGIGQYKIKKSMEV